MSTNARIFVPAKDGSFNSIYIHWDGYPSHVGRMLRDHYSNIEDINNLIDLGYLSDLQETPEECVAYHRDRNEDLVIEQFEELPDRNQEYEYLFKDGHWFARWGGTDWTPIDKAIALGE